MTPTRFRFLVCSDVDAVSATKMTEKFVPSEPEFDAVILTGPFCHRAVLTKEDMAVMEADMASIIAQFENIVCRVVYLPTEYDPPDVRTEQLFLTPNSINIHGRQINLTSNLRILGFGEKNQELHVGKIPRNVDRSAESDDELEDVAVASGQSASIIQEMLSNSTPGNNDTEVEPGTSLKPSSSTESGSGIFLLHYRFSHTLNQLLFHMPHDLDNAGISLCIISSSECPETARLPTKFGKLNIAAPKSLRKDGQFLVVDIAFNESTKAWDKITIESRTL